MIMKEYIDAIRSRYDYILIDCMPSLGMMTINALVSSDSAFLVDYGYNFTHDLFHLFQSQLLFFTQLPDPLGL